MGADNFSFRFLSVLLGLCIFSAFLVFQENEEDVILESIPLDVYDNIVQEYPDASNEEIVRIYLEDGHSIVLSLKDSLSSFQN